jgi:hypothetical protein
MTKLSGSSSIDGRLNVLLLTPSWLSGIIGSLLSTLFCLGIIFSLQYRASSIRVDFLKYQGGQVNHLYQDVSNSLLANNYLSNVPLLFFWGLVGVVVYIFAANIFGAVQGTAELTSELNYVHANRHKLLQSAIIRLCFRLLVLGVWWVYTLLFLHQVLPYIVSASIVGSSQLQRWQTTEYTVLAIVVMAVALHVHIVLLRLLLLRPRIFSSVLYIDTAGH